MIATMIGAKPSEMPCAVPGLRGNFTLVQRSQAKPWDECITALYGFLYLEDDWNGEGALPPQVPNVYSAIELVQMLRDCDSQLQAPQAVPGVNGEVLLVWVMGSSYEEAEISSSGRAEWMLTKPGQPAKHWVTTFSRDGETTAGRQMTTAATLHGGMFSGRATSGATLPAEPAA